MEDIVPVNLLLMANTIKVNNSKWIQNVFDLKGSIVNREVKMTSDLKPTSTLKDVNLQRIKKELSADKIDFLRFAKEDVEKINK